MLEVAVLIDFIFHKKTDKTRKIWYEWEENFPEVLQNNVNTLSAVIPAEKEKCSDSIRYRKAKPQIDVS